MTYLNWFAALNVWVHDVLLLQGALVGALAPRRAFAIAIA